MTKPMIKIHNATTDEVIEREMTKSEYDQYLIDVEAAKAKAEAAAKTSATKAALLEKLGMTEDEAKLLLG